MTLRTFRLAPPWGSHWSLQWYQSSYKDTHTFTSKRHNIKKVLQSNFKETQHNYRETPSNYRETQSNYKETQKNYKEKQSNYKEKQRNYKEKQSNFKEKQINWIIVKRLFGSRGRNSTSQCLWRRGTTRWRQTRGRNTGYSYMALKKTKSETWWFAFVNECGICESLNAVWTKPSVERFFKDVRMK